MYLKMNVIGKEADKVSYILGKNPNNHYSTNQRVFVENDFTNSFSDSKSFLFNKDVLEKLSLNEEKLSILKKDRVINKDLEPIEKPSKNTSYFIEDGKLIRRKNKDSEGHLFFKKYTPEEVEFLIFGQVDSLTYSKEYNGYVNEKEFEVNSIFQSILSNTIKDTLDKNEEKYSDLIYDCKCLIGPFRRTLEDETIMNLFNPLGFEVSIKIQKQDLSFENKRNEVYTLELSKKDTLQNTLRQIYVLISALDSYKHFKITKNDVEKFKKYTDCWLEKHPLSELITKRYLTYTQFGNDIIEKINKKKELAGEVIPIREQEEYFGEGGEKLNETRMRRMKEAILRTEPKSLLDFGCGEGNLLKEFVHQTDISLTGVDSSIKALEKFDRHFYKYKKLSEEEQTKISIPTIKQGSLYYIDSELKGKFDTIVLCEVIEHIEKERLEEIFDNLMYLKPKNLIISTPNRDFNKNFEFLKNPNGFRYYDHRFEFNVEEFKDFCLKVMTKYNFNLGLYKDFGKEIDGEKPTMIYTFSY